MLSMRALSQFFLFFYRAQYRLRCKCFSLLAAGAFGGFGRRTALMLPIQLSGESRMVLGDCVYVGAGSWLQTLSDGRSNTTAITIGSGTSIAGACVISAAESITLEEDVLLARNVYISDHIHRYDDIGKPILNQGITKILPVLIKRGAWLGQNVVVCPGVTIGQGAVIGANSVVNRDIPAFTLAAGVPAKVIRNIAPKEDVLHA